MEREYAEEGTLHAFYTLDGWFVKVKQAFAIGRVNFSFVEKGKQGKGFDIYVPIDKFDNLCDSILSNELKRKIEESKSQYPDSWKFTTGKDGCKEINIGKGQKGIVIQGRNKEMKKNVFIPVQNYDELRTMAKWFRRVSKKYMDDLALVCANANMYISPETKKELDEDTGYAENNVSSTPKNEPKTPTQNNSHTDKINSNNSDNSKNSANTTNANNTKPSEQKSITKLTLRSMGPLESMKTEGCKYMKCTFDGSNESINLIFLKDNIDKVDKDKWKQFVEKTSGEEHLKFSCECTVVEKENKKSYFFAQFKK